MNQDNQTSVNQITAAEQYTFQTLPVIQDLQNSGNLIQTHITGHNWTMSFHCITQLRKINKFYPEYIPDIIERFSSTILDLLGTGKTILAKNIMKLIKELFDAGQQINIEKAVYAFLPILIKKASTEIGSMKTMIQEVLTSFSNNCGYEISFVIASQFCCDKNATIAELSIKLLAALVQKVQAHIMQLSETTLTAMMKCLINLIDGKRKNLKTSALDICIFIFNAIGSGNYLQMMQFCLKQEEAQMMGMSMQTHRLDKQKPMRLKQAIKHRNTQKFNADFFNDNKLNVNFIPLPVNSNEQFNNGNNTTFTKSNSYSYSNTGSDINSKGFSKNNSSYNYSNNQNYNHDQFNTNNNSMNTNNYNGNNYY